MYPKLLPQSDRCHYQKLAIMLAMLIFSPFDADGSRQANVSHQALKGYSSISDDGEDRNTSRCLLSYRNMDPQELFRCKR